MIPAIIGNGVFLKRTAGVTDEEGSFLGYSALDRLANASYQIVIEGSSFRESLSPQQALLGAKGVIDRPTAT